MLKVYIYQVFIYTSNIASFFASLIMVVHCGAIVVCSDDQLHFKWSLWLGQWLAGGRAALKKQLYFRVGMCFRCIRLCSCLVRDPFSLPIVSTSENNKPGAGWLCHDIFRTCSSEL